MVEVTLKLPGDVRKKVLKALREEIRAYEEKYGLDSRELVELWDEALEHKRGLPLPEGAVVTLAVILYKEGKLTLKQAADLAGLSIEDFLLELGRRKVSFTNITLEELREEFEEISHS